MLESGDDQVKVPGKVLWRQRLLTGATCIIRAYGQAIRDDNRRLAAKIGLEHTHRVLASQAQSPAGCLHATESAAANVKPG